MRDLQNAGKFAARRKRNNIWRSVVTAIAALVVFCTTYALILPAITMEKPCELAHAHTQDCVGLVCGLEEVNDHFHSEACYSTSPVCEQEHEHTSACFNQDTLICQLEESTEHFHKAACYSEAQELTCLLAEGDIHTHSEDCDGVTDTLICNLEETEGHSHDDSCRGMVEKLTCGKEQTEGHLHDQTCQVLVDVPTCQLEQNEEHTHDASCYVQQIQFTCGLEEVEPHTHDASCYTQEEGLLCGKEEIQPHTHTQDCHREDTVLICTLEEGVPHVHAEGCYTKKKELTCGLEEPVVHRHSEDCYGYVCGLEEHECGVDCETEPEGRPMLTTLRSPVPLSEPVSFLPFLKDVSGQVRYIPAQGETDPYYYTSVVMEYATTKEQIQKDGGTYYLDLSKDIDVVDPAKTYTITDSDKNMNAGTFRFEKIGTGEDAHYRMLIDFSQDYLNKVEGPITGTMYFNGNVDANHDDNEGNFSVQVTDNHKINIESKFVEFDNKTGENYDVKVEKTHTKTVEEGQMGWYGQAGTPGHVKMSYTVKVSSEKGTPGTINLTDQMSWTQSGTIAKSCTLKEIKVDGQVMTLTPTGEGQSREIALELSQLEAGGEHVIEYIYDFEFQDGDTDSIYGVNNTVKAESKVPNGRPEEKVTDDASDHEDGFSPPFSFPDISKNGKLADGNDAIEWTIIFNSEKKTYYTMGNGYTITDVKLADRTSIKFLVDGEEYSGSDLYVKNDGSITIPDSMSGKKVEIVYTTPRGAVGDYGDTATAQTNTAQFWPAPWMNPVKAQAEVSKKGGGLEKKAGNPQDTTEGVLIPWTITITPGLNGIPTDKPLTDTLLTNNHTFDTTSLQVVYVDESGSVVGDPITGFTNSFEGSTMSLQFTSNPFGQDESGASVAPAGATAVQVRYNSKLNEGLIWEQNLGNKSEFSGFESSDYKKYTPSNAEVTKKSSPGKDSQGNDVINWEIWVSLNSGSQITTGLADSLKGAAGEGTHYFIENSVQVYYAGWGYERGQLDSSAYSVQFYQDGTLPVMTGTGYESGKNTYMTIQFTNPPLDIPNNSNGILVKYQTAYEGTPALDDAFRNKTWVMNKNAEATYSLPDTEVTKTHAEPTVKGTQLSIPWTVTVTTVDGKISSPIRDSLRLDANSFSHYFDESVTPTLYWVDEWGNYKDQIPITVTRHKDYTGTLSEAVGTGGEAGKNTYVEIVLNNAVDGVITNQWGWKTVRLHYSTLSNGIPEDAVEYKNEVYANGRKAVDQFSFTPILPKITEKSYNESAASVTQEGIVIPWTVKIKRGTVSLSSLYDALDQMNNSVVHYYLPDTLSLEYADANGNRMGEYVPSNAYSVTYYAGHNADYASDGTITLTPTGTINDPKSTYMEITFTGDPFAEAQGDAMYLLVHYSSRTDGVPVQDANNPYFNAHNVATLRKGGERFESTARFISSTVTKKAKNPSTNQFEEGQIDLGKNDTGELTQWEIQALTGKPCDAKQLTLTDVLPEYVILESITGSWKPRYHGEGGTFTLSIDGESGTITGSESTGTFSVSGTCVKNKDEQYMLTLNITAVEGKSLSPETYYTFYLTPKVNVDELPVPLQGKDFLLNNTADISIDGVTLSTKPSILKWEHDHPDAAQDALSKNQIFAAGKKSLAYSVEINPEAKDLEYASNSVVLIDTLTYNESPESFTNITGAAGVTLQKLSITLNTGEPFAGDTSGMDEEALNDTKVKKPMLYYAQKDEGGKPILNNGALVKGEAVPTSLWAMTTDRLNLGGGRIQNIIRLSVPDNTALILEYSYDVRVQYTPENAVVQQLSFDFEAENTIDAYGHKNSSSTSGGKNVRYLAASGGGNASASTKTLTIKKVDSVNESILLPGAKFDLKVFRNNDWVSIIENEQYLLTSSDSSKLGTIVISSDLTKNTVTLAKDTLYKLVEKEPPTGYAMPESPEEILFYISSAEDTLDPTLKAGAVDLSESSKTVTVPNTSVMANFAVQKSWVDYKGNPTSGLNSVDFDLVQVKSTKKPTEVFNPLASTRTVKVSVNPGWNNSVTIDPITVPKGAKVQVLFTTPTDEFTEDWKYPSTVSSLTDLSKQKISNREYRYVFSVKENLDLTFTVNVNSAVNVSVVQQSNGSSGGTEGDVLTIYPITLYKANGYNWYSKDFDTVPDVEGDESTLGIQHLPYTEKVDGVQYWYSYYVVEKPGNYIVTYDNVDENGNFVGVSFTDIHVKNQETNNPSYSLPETGGAGTGAFTAAGLALVLGAGVGLVKKRRRGDVD